VAHRLRDVIALDLPLVDPIRALPYVRSVLTQPAFEHRAVERRELPDGSKVPAGQHLAGTRPHAPETLQRQWCQERGLLAGGDDDEAVGLAKIGAHLRAQLVRGHADRDDETAALSDRSFDLFG